MRGTPPAPSRPRSVVPFYRLSLSKITRGEGRSAVAAAAYRSGERLHEERVGRTHDYRRRRNGITTRRLIGWEGERADLWNAAQQAERRRNSVEAREVQLGLPAELPAFRRRELALGFASWLRDRYRVAVDVAIHLPGKRGSARNHHAHLLMTTRVVEAGVLGRKVRLLDDLTEGPKEVEAMRAEWARLLNEALYRARVRGRVEHRSRRRMDAESKGVEQTTPHRAPTTPVPLPSGDAEEHAEAATVSTERIRRSDRLHSVAAAEDRSRRRRALRRNV